MTAALVTALFAATAIAAAASLAHSSRKGLADWRVLKGDER